MPISRETTLGKMHRLATTFCVAARLERWPPEIRGIERSEKDYEPVKAEAANPRFNITIYEKERDQFRYQEVNIIDFAMKQELTISTPFGFLIVRLSDFPHDSLGTIRQGSISCNRITYRIDQKHVRVSAFVDSKTKPLTS